MFSMFKVRRGLEALVKNLKETERKLKKLLGYFMTGRIFSELLCIDLYFHRLYPFILEFFLHFIFLIIHCNQLIVALSF